MKTPKYYFLSGVGVTLAIIVAIIALIGLSSDGNYKVISSAKSPDGKHVAIVYGGMGGGAAGWCSLYVAIEVKDSNELIGKEKHNYDAVVYDGSCGTDPETEWIANDRLTIKYRGPKDQSGIRLYKRPLSHDSAVKVSFTEL